jgi:peptide/nickel transport system substrate-binding protein
MWRWRTAIAGAWMACAVVAASAASLRVASGFDPQTMDPHALALLSHSRVITQVYESLVGRDEQFRLEPARARSWQAF